MKRLLVLAVLLLSAVASAQIAPAMNGRYVYKSEGWLQNLSGEWQPFFEIGQFRCVAGTCKLIGVMNFNGKTYAARSIWTVKLNTWAQGGGTSTAGDVATIVCSQDAAHCYFEFGEDTPAGGEWQKEPWLAEFTRDGSSN